MPNPLPPQKNKWTILDTLHWTTGYFKTRQIDSPRITAEILLSHVLGLKRIDLYLRYDQPLTQEELGRFKALIQRRAKREPTAYILGQWEFWGLELQVNRHTLVPRPETEILVEAALACVGNIETGGEKRILDLGTGSGAIILAMAKERPGHAFFAVDQSLEALKTAKGNATALGMGQAVFFLAGDWFSPFKEQSLFDLILANPPYIPSDVLPTLSPEVSHYEPRRALDGGADGLESLKRIAGSAHLFLKPGGFLLMEMGYDQKASVEKFILNSERYDSVKLIPDYAGKTRVVQMRKPAEG